MPRYKVTLFLGSGKTGASEAWFSKEFTASELAAPLQGLINARNAILLKNSARIDGVRVSEVGGLRRSFVIEQGTTVTPLGFSIVIPTTGAYAFETIPVQQDEARRALQLKVSYQSGKEVTRYLAYVPDDSVTAPSGAYNPNEPGGWDAKLRLYFSELASNWSIQALAPASATPPALQNPLIKVAGVSLEAVDPKRVGIIVPTATDPGYVFGDLVRITGFRFKKATPTVSINGRYHIDQVLPGNPTGFTTYLLRELKEVVVGNLKVIGKIQGQLKSFYEVGRVRVQKGLQHKRGGPFGAPVGRRSIHLTQDP